MRIWKALGWDTKEARTERVKDNNKHGTIRTVAFCVTALAIAALIASA